MIGDCSGLNGSERASQSQSQNKHKGNQTVEITAGPQPHIKNTPAGLLSILYPITEKRTIFILSGYVVTLNYGMWYVSGASVLRWDHRLLLWLRPLSLQPHGLCWPGFSSQQNLCGLLHLHPSQGMATTKPEESENDGFVLFAFSALLEKFSVHTDTLDKTQNSNIYSVLGRSAPLTPDFDDVSAVYGSIVIACGDAWLNRKSVDQEEGRQLYSVGRCRSALCQHPHVLHHFCFIISPKRHQHTHRLRSTENPNNKDLPA